MKLSLLSCLFAASVALVACGDEAAAPEPAAPAPPAEAPEPPAPSPRKLVAKAPQPTSPANLVVDPQFQSLWTPIDETGYGIYESFVSEGERTVELRPVTPAGPGVAVLAVEPTGSDATLTMTVVGSKGPLSARVWAAVPDGKKLPDVELVSLYTGASMLLVPEESTRTSVDGRSYVRLSGVSAEDMPGQLYFVASVRSKGTRIVAPEVLAGPAAKTMSAMGAHGTAPRRAASPRALRAASSFERLRASHVIMAPPPQRRPPARRLTP